MTLTTNMDIFGQSLPVAFPDLSVMSPHWHVPPGTILHLEVYRTTEGRPVMIMESLLVRY